MMTALRVHSGTLAQPSFTPLDSFGVWLFRADFGAPITDLVEALVRGDFDSLEADGRAGRVGVDGLRRSITEYGRTLVVLPDEAFDLVEAGMVTARPGEWWIVVPMWTDEEGQSDLSLELVAIPTDDGHRLEVTDLHVL